MKVERSRDKTLTGVVVTMLAARKSFVKRARSPKYMPG